MSSMYLLDANTLITAHRSTYPLGVARSFWSTVSKLAKDDVLCSIDKVRNEIYYNEDPLTQWCKENIDGRFWQTSGTCLTEYQRLIQWAQRRADHYTTNAIRDFMRTDNADPWLIAFAMQQGITIVTQEIASPERKRRIKIPDACAPFRIRCVTLMEMFVEIGAEF